MARVACVVAALLVIGFAVPAAARADADPASDYLYTTNVFLPLTTKVSPGLARELRAVTAAAAKSGKPIRVALIATPTDLGGVPALFGKPIDYARFLDAELQFVYSGRLLVVMPQGAALAAHGRLEADESVVHAKVEPGGDGLARTAITLVRELSGQTPRSSGTASTSSGTDSSGIPVWVWAVVAGGIICLVVLVGLVIVRRRRPAA
jgi:hypothetical protein